MAKRGHDVTVLTSFPSYPYNKIYAGYGFDIPYEKNYHGVNIERIKSSPRGKTKIGLLKNCISFVLKGKKWVDNCKTQYDVVYVYTISPNTVGLVARYYKNKFKNCLVINNIQDLWPENIEHVLNIKFKPFLSFIKYLMKKIYESSDYLLCSSRSFVEYIKANSKIESEKLVYWPQFFNEINLCDLKKPEIYNKYENDIIKITFTGNVGFTQGLHLIIKTAEYINKNKNYSVRWFIVGDGRAKNSLISKVKQLLLEDDIIFIDKVSTFEACEYSHYADFSFLSFDNIIFNMTIPAKLQGYLASGSLVLCVAGGESKNIIVENNCGFVVDVNDSNEKMYKICEYIEKYKNMSNYEIKKMKNNAFECYKKNFTLKKLVDELEIYINKGK